MYILPECNVNTVVGVVYKGKFSWYVTEREFWYLNMIMEDGLHGERVGIEILDTDTFEVFQKRIEIYKTSTDELREYFIIADEYNKEDAYFDFFPSFYINFDKKIFYSLYKECLAFELYVPEKWVGEYEDFIELNLIDDEYKYWITDTGENLLNFSYK